MTTRDSLYNSELLLSALALLVYIVCALLAAPFVWLYKATRKDRE